MIASRRVSPVHLRNLARLSQASGVVILLIGGTVLAAWIFGWDRAKSLSENFPAMTPNSAIGFILIGSMLTARSLPVNRFRGFMMPLVSLSLMIVGLTAILEHFLPAHGFWINHFAYELLTSLQPELARGPVEFPVMSSGICFSLLGLSLWLQFKKPALAQLVLIPVFVVVFFSLLLQSFHFAFSRPLSSRAFFTAMAPHTALCIFLAILGMLGSSPRTGFVSKLLSQTPSGEVFRILGVLIIGIPILLIATSVALEALPASDADFVHSFLFLAIVSGFLLATYLSVRSLDISEGRFFQLMEQAGDGILLADLSGVITEANHAATSLLGCASTEDIIRQPLLNFLPRDYAPILDSVRFQLLKPEAVFRGDWQIIRKDGRSLPVEVCSKILSGNLWQMTIRDVSAQRRYEEQLKFLSHSADVLTKTLDYQDRVQKIAELLVPSVADFCIVFTKEEGDLEVSATSHSNSEKREFLRNIAGRFPSQVSQLVGHEAEEGAGIRIVENITDESYRKYALNEEHLSLLREVGTRSYLSAPLVLGKQVIGALSMGFVNSGRAFSKEEEGFYRQIVYRFSAELENARLYRDAKIAVRSREDILAVVSHDLNNPIAAATMAVQLAEMTIERGAANEQVMEYLSKVRHSMQRMKRLVDMLLNFAKLQAGTFQARKKEISLGSVFSDVEEVFRPIAKRAGIALEFSLSREIRLMGDFGALSQGVSNLLSNAVKFSPAGSKIRVSGRYTGDSEVEICVEDQGPGIAKNIQPRLFDRYWQPPESRDGGSGLGLFIVKGVAKAHGGEATVDSDLGKGSRFYIRFPAGLDVREALQSVS